MPFNSFEFILLFLPLCYAGYLIVHRLFGWGGVYAYLGAVSVYFYSLFSIQLALVLIVSACANFGFGRWIASSRETDDTKAGWIMTTAIAANLIALGYFKYTNFFIDIANSLASTGISHLNIIVPVGVSFFTFTQIGYLIDARSGQAKEVGFSRYFLFATFFPCITAGPLLSQRDIFCQMEKKTGKAFDSTNVSIALTLFGIGLFKKVVLADSMAPYADGAFDSVALGASIDWLTAWIAALCYSLQLYFDFSGYSDMAVALGVLFGIRLPLNFNSPFKRSSISEFWRCWHMTMTRFFTSYLYTPMAMRMTRAAMKGGYSQALKWVTASAWPLFYTFLLAGVWHGAGWTFVLYGAIHGAALAVDHGWRHFKMPNVGRELGWFMTMLVVVTGLVVFRAPDLDTAYVFLSSMWAGMNIQPDNLGQVYMDLWQAAPLVLALGALVLAAPNSQEIMRNVWVSSDPEPSLDASEETPAKQAMRWVPSTSWALLAAGLLIIAGASIGDGSGFLYYKF